MTRLQSWTGLSDSPAGPWPLNRVRITLFNALQLGRLHSSLWQPGMLTQWPSSGLVGLQTSRHDPVFPRDCLGDCPEMLIATFGGGSLWRPGNLNHIVLMMEDITNCPAWKLLSLRTPQSAVPWLSLDFYRGAPPQASAQASVVDFSERVEFHISAAAPAFAFLPVNASDVPAGIVAPVFHQHAVGGAPLERFLGDGQVHVSQVRQVAGALPRAPDHRPHRPASQHLAMLSALTPSAAVDRSPSRGGRPLR
jgi:hypothetical protein